MNPSTEKRIPLDDALDTLKAAYDTKKHTYIENKIREIETAHITRKSKLAWATVNEMTNRKKSRAARPSGDHPSERIKLWEEHFKDLLGRPASLPPHPEEIDSIISETLPIPVHEFTMKELIAAIRKNMDMGQLTAALFIDLQKAFDTLDHQSLTSKLLHQYSSADRDV